MEEKKNKGNKSFIFYIFQVVTKESFSFFFFLQEKGITGQNKESVINDFQEDAK